jgi:hypothetical protein
MGRGSLILTLGWMLPAHLSGQSLEHRVAALGSGNIQLSFAGRPSICGNGLNNISIPQANDEWVADCEAQPVRVALRVHNGRVVSIRTYVGGRWRSRTSVNDFGTVRPQDAAAYLLKLAAQPGELSGDPLLPATLADSVTIWPSLLRLARTQQLPEERRRSAIFWLGQAAGAAAASALDSVAIDRNGSREVRKQAVFALSQRPASEGVPALLRIARTNHDPEIRKTAIFWLAQSEDPRALELFEEILR